MITSASQQSELCENDYAFTTDVSPVTRLEFDDERPARIDVRVVRVEFAGSGDENVLVRRQSHADQRKTDPSVR